MAEINVVVLEGHLTKNAELSYFNGQTAYCTFTVATNEVWKNKETGEWQSKPSFIDCQYINPYAESKTKELIKGRAIRVTGSLKQSQWEDNGQKKSRVFIKVSNISLSPIINGEAQNNYQTKQQPQIQKKEPQQFNVDDINNEEFIPFNEGPEFSEDIPF